MKIESTWTPAEVRAWIDRHGGNISALARRLRCSRTALQSWASESEGDWVRTIDPKVQAHMETIDRHEVT